MDGGAWWATVHGVAKSQTQPRDLPLLTLIVLSFVLGLFQSK